jgi:hypothetical protein
MTDRGWEGDVSYIRPDGTAGQTVEHARRIALNIAKLPELLKG